MSSTVFIPTVAFLGLILTGVLAKAVLMLFRRGAMYVLEKETEVDTKSNPKDFTPGAHTGVLLSVLAAIAKLLSM